MAPDRTPRRRDVDPRRHRDAGPSARPSEGACDADERPVHWASLEPLHTACAREGIQSPIDLTDAVRSDEEGIRVERPDVLIRPGTDVLSNVPASGCLGSFTTPACVTDVEWLVMQMALVANREQIATFAAKLGRNDRPIQPRGGRVIRPIPFARSVRS